MRHLRSPPSQSVANARVEDWGRKTQKHLPLPHQPFALDPQQLRLPPSLHWPH